MTINRNKVFYNASGEIMKVTASQLLYAGALYWRENVTTWGFLCDDVFGN